MAVIAGNVTITLDDPATPGYNDGKRVMVSRADALPTTDTTGRLTITATNAQIVRPGSDFMPATSVLLSGQWSSMTFRLDKPSDWATTGARWWIVDRPSVDDL